MRLLLREGIASFGARDLRFYCSIDCRLSLWVVYKDVVHGDGQGVFADPASLATMSVLPRVYSSSAASMRRRSMASLMSWNTKSARAPMRFFCSGLSVL